MLANKATLEFKNPGATSYTKLKGLKELPDMGMEPEKVENTNLEDTVKKYEQGVGEPGDLTYKFQYDNSAVDSPYRLMREAQASGKTLSFRETLIDGSVAEFDSQVTVKRTGGSLNSVLDFELSMALQSDIVYVDPV